MSYLHQQSMYVSNECSGKYVLLDRLVWILVSQSVNRFLVKTSVLQRHLYYYYFFVCYSSKCLVFLFVVYFLVSFPALASAMFLLSYGCLCFESISRGAMSWSVIVTLPGHTHLFYLDERELIFIF